MTTDPSPGAAEDVDGAAVEDRVRVVIAEDARAEIDDVHNRVQSGFERLSRQISRCERAYRSPPGLMRQPPTISICTASAASSAWRFCCSFNADV